MKTCLMLTTPDKRRYFTSKENYNKLGEFANTFNCEIALVKLKEGQILEWAALAKAVAAHQTMSGDFEIIELKKTKKPRKSRN